MNTKNKELQTWVDEVAILTNPSEIYWCDGSKQEFQNINTGLALSDAGFRSQNNLIGINRPINRPSFLTAALGAVSGAASGARTGLDIQAALKATG